MAVTAGFWCLAASLTAPAAAECVLSGAGGGAGTDCQADGSSHPALLRTGAAARIDTEKSSWSPAQAHASQGALVATETQLGWQAHVGRQAEQSTRPIPIFHVAPKQSPPALAG